jgi:CheY-like chemotaxis protein
MPSPCPKCILVIDDDNTIRELIGEVLQIEGYRVETAENGQQALAKVGTTRPDAILLDLMMPVMDGWTFLQECKTDPQCGGRPVAVMSAYQVPQNAGALGVKSVLPKPFDVDALLDTVEYLLQFTA